MEIIRRKNKGSNNSDELATVKAAAWAWYQHGSGSEGKPIPEFDITRAQRVPRPSRYKLEAMRISENARRSTTTHANNSLLDTYEIESISKRLGDLILHSNATSGRFFDWNISSGYVGDRHRSSDDGDHHHSDGKKKKSKKLKGFMLKHAAICGTSQDVATRALSPRNHQKHSPRSKDG